MDQKVDIEEFISRVKEVALSFNNLSEEKKMMLRHWLRNTLSDELKDKLGEKIEDILIANKEEVMIMTSNISKTIKETFEKVREEGIEEGIEKGIEEGIKKGIKKGIEKGIEKGKIDMALEMLKDGEPIEKIIKYSKLREEEILKLREKLIQ